jgi:hypothetical protein
MKLRSWVGRAAGATPAFGPALGQARAGHLLNDDVAAIFALPEK